MNDKIIKLLLEYIQLPQSAYEQSERRYQSLSDWLGRNGSPLLRYEPQVQPQGSFRLGTAIYPQGRNAEYDLDLTNVYKKGLSPQIVSQRTLRLLVKKELDAYARNLGLQQIEDKNRCCRLNYKSSSVADCGFHMDIVPAIPALEKNQKTLIESYQTFSVKDVGKEEAVQAILITDKRRDDYDKLDADWLLSNPEGYALWFENKLKQQQFGLFSDKFQKVHIPTWKRNTVLQSIIQLLKWHRDVMFEQKDDEKPISIIITTLVAKVYNGESLLSEGLNNVLEKLHSAINTKSPYVPNPVNPQEDFADKWDDAKYQSLQLRKNCFSWIGKAQVDFRCLLSSNSSSEEIKKVLLDAFKYKYPSEELVNIKPRNYALYDDRNDENFVLVPAFHRSTILSVCSDINLHYSVTIEGTYDSFHCSNFFQSNDPLEKNLQLTFTMTTNAPEPYQVFWQVGNTGEEARNANDLRGTFFRGSDTLQLGKHKHEEHTKYTGAHWVQCIIVKDGVCVGRSRDFVVRIV